MVRGNHWWWDQEGWTVGVVGWLVGWRSIGGEIKRIGGVGWLGNHCWWNQEGWRGWLGAIGGEIKKIGGVWWLRVTIGGGIRLKIIMFQ